MKPLLVALFSAVPTLAAADVSLVGAAEVHAAVVGDPKTVVIDARTAGEYEQAHIPGSINIPPGQMTAAQLPRDHATPLIFYCRGVG